MLLLASPLTATDLVADGVAVFTLNNVVLQLHNSRMTCFS